MDQFKYKPILMDRLFDGCVVLTAVLMLITFLLPIPYPAKALLGSTIAMPVLFGIPAAEVVFLVRLSKEARLLRIKKVKWSYVAVGYCFLLAWVSYLLPFASQFFPQI
jgi:hypothetical protein